MKVFIIPALWFICLLLKPTKWYKHIRRDAWIYSALAMLFLILAFWD